MRATTTCLLFALLVWCSPGALAQAINPVTEKDLSIYDTLYREKLLSVRRTRSTSDDLTLAQEMLAFAKSVPDDPGVQCLIYIDVIPLSAAGSDLALMMEASELLKPLWPGHEAVSPDYQLNLASRAYRDASRSDRPDVGQLYIDLLLRWARHYEQRDDMDQAIALCRQANTVARAIDSDKREQVEETLEQLAAENALTNRIKMLALSVSKNPQNRPAARELVDLLLTKRNDPDTAAKYIESTGDEELIDIVKRCAKGIDQANAPTALRVGDWYLALAEDQQDRYAEPLLRSARAWYQRFLTQYTRQDALATRVEAMHQIATDRARRIAELNTEPDNAWTPLTAPPFDVNKHLIDRPTFLQVEDGQIAIDDGQFAVPFTPAKAYEVRLTLTVHEPEPFETRAFMVQLPVGDDHAITTRYYCKGGTAATLEDLIATLLIQDAPDRVNQKVQITLQIVETNGQVAFAVLYNGKAAAKWKGIRHELPVRDDENLIDLPEDIGPVMLIRCVTKLTLHNVEYRKHTD